MRVAAALERLTLKGGVLVRHMHTPEGDFYHCAWKPSMATSDSQSLNTVGPSLPDNLERLEQELLVKGL